MDDFVERVAEAIECCETPYSSEALARAAIAECFKWRPIEEYDALTKKPDNCVFWVEKDINQRRPDLSLAAQIHTSRNMGARTITHWFPLPEPPKKTEKEKQG